MMYLLATETEIWGIFTTEKDAKAAKKELVDKEFAEWQTDSCGKDELLAEATSEESMLYNHGEMTIEEFECYPKIYSDWAECYHIIPIEINKIHQINLN